MVTTLQRRRAPAPSVWRLAAMLLWLPACVAHPGLPALDHSDYVAKASLASKDAISTLATASLTLDAVAKGHTWENYAGGVLDDQIDRLGDVASSFESVQPPDVASRALRADVVQALGDAQDHLGQAVVAFDAGQTTAALAMRPALAEDIAALQEFVTS